MPAECEVLICGLGPVGQLLALLLGKRGISVVAIDQAPHPFDLPRAAVIDDEVLRIFQSAGIRDEVLRASQIQDEVTFVPDRGGPLTLLEPDGTLHGQAGLVSIHQPSMEKTIIQAAKRQATVDMRWNCRLADFTQTGCGVRATLSEDGETRNLGAKWLIGCDGGGSWVRRLLGIEFGGSTFRQRWLVVDVEVEQPLTTIDHPHFFGDPQRPVVSLPMSPGRHRWEWMLHPGEDEAPMLDPRAIQERVDPWLGGRAGRVERAVVYTFHRRTAARWREGRTLLAGDAAHLMPPFAGQGFSSGARDAANLAWKLEAALGGAPEALLDSYEAERRPHVDAMGRLAVSLGRFVQTTSPRISVGRDLLLGFLNTTGIAKWARRRIKPVPAYGEGAFATPPSRLAFNRVVGSQFPQPRVGAADGRDLPFDEVAGPEWIGLSARQEFTDQLAAAGISALSLGRDFEDPDSVITNWLAENNAKWVILRPDRFVYAVGGDRRELRQAVAQRRSHLGRAG